MGSNQRRHVTIQYPLKHILAIAAITLLLTLAHAVGSSDSMGDQQLPAQSTTQLPPSTVLHPSSTSRSPSPSTSRSPPSSPSSSPSHSSSPSSHLPPLDSRLSSAIRNVIHDGLLASRTAHREFCDCDSSLYGAEMCAAMTRQCKASFCNPICLGMGWTIELEVDCQAAPGWKYCQQFKDEVEDAAKAITAQFQAHICMSTGFCNRTSTLVDWVENHTYGHKYPNHMLPIDSCLPHLHDLHPAIAASTCNACSKVVSAKIRRGTCQMGFTAGYELKEMSTFQERVSSDRGQRNTEMQRFAFPIHLCVIRSYLISSFRFSSSSFFLLLFPLSVNTLPITFRVTLIPFSLISNVRSVPVSGVVRRAMGPAGVSAIFRIRRKFG